MGRQRHKPVNDENLVKRWAEGWTAKAIAAEQGTDPMAVCNRVSKLRKAGVKLARRGAGRSVDVERLNALLAKKSKKTD